jgi:hypothetical protein
MARCVTPHPLWFFGVLQTVLGQRADFAIATVAALTCVSQLIFVLALHRSLGARSRWPLAATLFIVASSPYEFFWSRSAWDLFTNFGPFLILSLLAASPFGPGRGALLGALCELAISAHPGDPVRAGRAREPEPLARGHAPAQDTYADSHRYRRCRYRHRRKTDFRARSTVVLRGARMRPTTSSHLGARDGTQLLSDTHCRDCCATAT